MRTYKNGFIVLDRSEDEKLLVYMDFREISLYDKERQEYLDFYKSEGLTGLAFENTMYHKDEHVEVLRDYPFIKQLHIGQNNIMNLDGIQYIDNLEALYIMDNGAPFDFKVLKNSLKGLTVDWHRKLTNLDSLKKLKSLLIWDDTDRVRLPKNIQYLSIYGSRRTNLDFLKTFKNLKELVLFRGPKLTDISGIKYCSDTLRELEIERCRKIEDHTPILNCKKLSKLIISKYDKKRKPELKKLKKKLGENVYFHV